MCAPTAAMAPSRPPPAWDGAGGGNHSTHSTGERSGPALGGIAPDRTTPTRSDGGVSSAGKRLPNKRHQAHTNCCTNRPPRADVSGLTRPSCAVRHQHLRTGAGCDGIGLGRAGPCTLLQLSVAKAWPPVSLGGAAPSGPGLLADRLSAACAGDDRHGLGGGGESVRVQAGDKEVAGGQCVGVVAFRVLARTRAPGCSR